MWWNDSGKKLYKHYCTLFTLNVQVWMPSRCFTGTYLVTAAPLGEFEAWNASGAAGHADIFWMFAVGHSEAVGLTLCQALLCTTAVHVVQPDLAWNDKDEGWKMDAEDSLNIAERPAVCLKGAVNSIKQRKCCLVVEGMCFWHSLHSHGDMFVASHNLPPPFSENVPGEWNPDGD